jgi:hypothetical protein
MAMWQHDVQCRSGIGPWTANTATNVIHVSPIKCDRCSNLSRALIGSESSTEALTNIPPP